jgi:hypothetical protein
VCKTSLELPLITKTTKHSCISVIFQLYFSYISVVFQLYFSYISVLFQLHKQPYQMFFAPCQRVGAASSYIVNVLTHSETPCHHPHKQLPLMNFQISEVMKHNPLVLYNYNVLTTSLIQLVYTTRALKHYISRLCPKQLKIELFMHLYILYFLLV